MKSDEVVELLRDILPKFPDFLPHDSGNGRLRARIVALLAQSKAAPQDTTVIEGVKYSKDSFGRPILPVASVAPASGEGINVFQEIPDEPYEIHYCRTRDVRTEAAIVAKYADRLRAYALSLHERLKGIE